jgi:hypothetical protein
MTIRNEASDGDFELLVKPIYDKKLLTIQDLFEARESGKLITMKFGQYNNIIREFIMNILQKYWPHVTTRQAAQRNTRQIVLVDIVLTLHFVLLLWQIFHVLRNRRTKQMIKIHGNDVTEQLRRALYQMNQKNYAANLKESQSHRIFYDFEEMECQTHRTMMACLLGKQYSKNTGKWTIGIYNDKMRLFSINRAIKNLPVNAKKAEWYNDATDRCAYCNEVEDIQHLALCVNNHDTVERLKRESLILIRKEVPNFCYAEGEFVTMVTTGLLCRNLYNRIRERKRLKGLIPTIMEYINGRIYKSIWTERITRRSENDQRQRGMNVSF